MLFSAHRAIPFLFSLACILPASAMAGYTSFTVFGDSLSDTGNVNIGTGGALPGLPYSNGRFSNGPVWVEFLSASLGLGPSIPSLIGGSNYAFGGARTGSGAVPPDLFAQTAGLWAPSHAVADATGLYVLVGGSNDMRGARTAFGGDSAADQLGRQNAADLAIANLKNSMILLASRGAKNLLLSNIIDLGMTPEATFLGVNAASADASARFNAQIAGLASYGTTLGLTVFTLDLDGLMKDVVNDALFNGGALFGMTNIFTPCGTFPGSFGAPCSSSLFSDALHPTTGAHALIAARAFALVQVDASEPAEAALMSLAVVALMVIRRRKIADGKN